MKKLFKSSLYFFGLVFVAIWLFTIHSGFAFILNPITDNTHFKESALFVFASVDFKVAIPYVWGATFAIAVSIIISFLDKNDKKFWLFAFVIASLEMSGVFLLTNTEIKDELWKMFSSFYYGVYGFTLIILYSYVKGSKVRELEVSVNNELRKTIREEINLYNGIEKEIVKGVVYNEVETILHNSNNNLAIMEEELRKKYSDQDYLKKKNIDLEEVVGYADIINDPNKERNQKIIEIYQLGGHTKKEISALLNISASTVTRVIQKHESKKDDSNTN